ncbi:hypothetical protein PV327_011039 [Microctonus hyperodae]|uniref:Uncharacterized protein n=1 Tax=Microctonus hyperodae TaxID=165561 RepID=A0AA39FRY6_MICHY|nr:hypothetical protein PV327_011039 [Microctonus hyperodae]
MYFRDDYQPHGQEVTNAHSSIVTNHSVAGDDSGDRDEVFDDDINENVLNETLINNMNINDHNHHDIEVSADSDEFTDDDNESEFSNDLGEDSNDHQEEFANDNESESSNDREADDDDIYDNDDSSDDDNIDEDEYDRPLYDGAPLSLAESLLSIFTFYITSNMTGVNFNKLLSLMALHFPASSIFKKTRHLFMKYFIHGQTPMIKHWYCSKCMSFCQNENSNCQCDGNPERWYFIEMSIIDQLQRLFAKPGFSDDLMYPYSRVKLHPNNIDDIYDGKIYREHASRNNPLSDPYNLSFTWYTDGAPVFKSRKYSVWPLYLTINELSTKESHEEHAKLALETGNPHFGVKGPSILDKLMPNMIRGVSVD